MLALLSGANPRSSKGGPVVRLQAGTWELSVDGLKDSKLHINRNSSPASTYPVTNGYQFTEQDAIEVRVVFTDRGTEKYITVNAKRV